MFKEFKVYAKCIKSVRSNDKDIGAAQKLESLRVLRIYDTVHDSQGVQSVESVYKVYIKCIQSDN